MITIYSTENGKLFTDPKKRAYIDSDLLTEKAVIIRTRFILNQIAIRIGFHSFDELRSYTRCCGVTEELLMKTILSGNIADLVRHLAV